MMMQSQSNFQRVIWQSTLIRTLHFISSEKISGNLEIQEFNGEGIQLPCQALMLALFLCFRPALTVLYQGNNNYH